MVDTLRYYTESQAINTIGKEQMFYVKIESQREQVARLACKIDRQLCDAIVDHDASKRWKAYVNATRLWNAIDCLDEPDLLWPIMTAIVPWAFLEESDPNSIRFAYAK